MCLYGGYQGIVDVQQESFHDKREAYGLKRKKTRALNEKTMG